MSRKRILITHAVAFAAGCAVMFGAVLLLGAYVVKTQPAQEKAASLLKRWGAFIDEEGLLTIPLPGTDMVVQIRTHKPASATDADDVIIARELIGAVFAFRWEGRYRLPSAQYAGGIVGSGHDWFDYNVDGMFDHHFDASRGMMEIRAGNRWIRAQKIVEGRAVTAEGRFAFDTERGHWNRVDE